MLSVTYTAAKNALGHLFPTKEDIDINEVTAYIQNAHIKDAESTTGEFNANDYQYKTGFITNITPLYMLVDNQYVCELVNVLIKDLQVGDKVEYLAEVTNEGQQKTEIKKILSLVDISWENEYGINRNTCAEETKTYNRDQALQRVMIGKVVKRDNRMLFVEPYNISIDLNKVQSEFIPIIGDWLQLESLVELNEQSVGLSGDIIEVNKIQPLRSKLDVGVVTSYQSSDGVGIIEKTIIFAKAACDIGYVPCVGDKVISDTIESDQGMYTWRSLSVVPIIQAIENETEFPTRQTFQMKEKGLRELLENKHGIIISNDLTVNLNVHEEKTVKLTVQNVSGTSRVLQKASFTSKSTEAQVALEHPITPSTPTVLKPCDSISYIFKCTAKFIGSTEELFVFDFQDFQIGRIFCIKVNAIKRLGNKQQSEVSRTKNRNWGKMPVFEESNEVTCIPGIRPFERAPFIKVRDVRFTVPRRYWDIILRNKEQGQGMSDCERELEKVDPHLAYPLQFGTYKARFHTLLYLEDIAQAINIQQYAMDSVVMRRSGDYLVMQVPGLAEKRPSLLVGDRAITSFKWDNSNGHVKYEGCIHRVTNTEIFLKFNESFHYKYNNEDCQVTFSCSKSAIQRCHNAVNLAITRLGANILFPAQVVQKPPQLNIEELETIDNLIHNNRERSSSISSVSSSTSTSTSITSTKSSQRIPVIKRLFNVDPGEQRAGFGKDVDLTTQSQKSNNLEKSLTQNGVLNKSDNTTESPKESQLESCIAQVKTRKLRWYNKNLNFYQKEAVRNILKGHGRPLPYIIFGPPGTGKTVTLCESILQILTMIPDSRMLIATPSNSSANLIAERLLDSGILKPGDMVRLIAHHCLGSDIIPDCLLPYCATADIATEGTRPQNKFSKNGAGPRLNCTISVLGRHRITISTCIAVGILNNMGFPRGHFTHVLVDEAGQATEPEIMIPLNFIRSDSGQIVLAGDPQQLGPVVVSKLAQSYGLDESFLSRLLNHFPYQKDAVGFERLYDPRVVTKLLMNYRSLPEILHISSSLFYDSELQPQVCPKQSKEAILIQTLAEELPKRDGPPPPIIFHGINGENCRDTDSPSWYNPEEATQVYLYLLKLYRHGLTADDIGVISPYQKQVAEIRDLLLELDVPLPKISSVEGFQGQERNIIIISTVRSCNSFVNDDIKHSLGFIGCPRRVNVAITRARALLIILGNPNLLARDPYWRSILRYCIDKKAYLGYNSFSLSVDDSTKN